ncbi:hypothetical protein P152DRAFT_91617 [Eremomyces bilateralis CBS 781.70]|uniref:Uncharacterized protein n=1 Tax=Eremomyces bilateralis CBS 781.70 TaxID=1392243 RepID=A0A6G1FXL1_9PEZI|nr:uncharacterized protein P152DRAFT_91617 [Eremomyces bilateralis CBS 781.70]KAF1810635.1 hypothetical protein P152DRAFT_91617 [Eremomyces bilateralis CBS 781.70]
MPGLRSFRTRLRRSRTDNYSTRGRLIQSPKVIRCTANVEPRARKIATLPTNIRHPFIGQKLNLAYKRGPPKVELRSPISIFRSVPPACWCSIEVCPRCAEAETFEQLHWVSGLWIGPLRIPIHPVDGHHHVCKIHLFISGQLWRTGIGDFLWKSADNVAIQGDHIFFLSPDARGELLSYWARYQPILDPDGPHCRALDASERNTIELPWRPANFLVVPRLTIYDSKTEDPAPIQPRTAVEAEQPYGTYGDVCRRTNFFTYMWPSVAIDPEFLRPRPGSDKLP